MNNLRNWVRGIDELYLCNFYIHLKLFVNFLNYLHLKSSKTWSESQWLIDSSKYSIVGIIGVPKGKNKELGGKCICKNFYATNSPEFQAENTTRKLHLGIL